MQAWVNEMAEYMKDLDPNHLLTLGEEGFCSLYKDGLSANPGVPGMCDCEVNSLDRAFTVLPTLVLHGC